MLKNFRSGVIYSLLVAMALIAPLSPNTASAQNSSGRPVMLRPPTDTQKQLEKFVLQVGIDKYQYVTQLDGCVQDVKDFRKVLVEQFKCPDDEKHFKTLLNSEATHENIIAAFRSQLIENAKKNADAIVIFQYSGHGSQADDLNGDKADHLDSTLVPVNSRDPQNKNVDIRDDEIRSLYEELSQYTSNITFILDCCHAGNI